MGDLISDFGGFEVEVWEGEVFNREGELGRWYGGCCC